MSFLQLRGGDTNNKNSSKNNSTDQVTSDDDVNASSSLSSLSADVPSWKQGLPPILQRKGPKTLQKINLGGTEIYLLGTAHVSNDSSADVKLLLEAVEPDCIFVELCEARISLLEGEQSQQLQEEEWQQNNNITSTKQLTFWEKLDQIHQSQGGSRLQALSTLLLTSVQEDYAETLNVTLGGEFRAAHTYWKQRNSPSPPVVGATTDPQQQVSSPPTRSSFAPPHPSLVLGDRPLSLTLVRAWESLWWWPKTKVLAGLIWSSFRKPQPDEIRAWLESVLREETDVLTESLKELQQHFPSLHTTIIAERDAWLAAKLVQTCRVLSAQQQQQQSSQLTRPSPKRVVAIVGAGHVAGMIEWLTGQHEPHTTPEQILTNLTFTKRWQHDQMVQEQMIPLWTMEVTQVQHNDAWAWTEPSTPTPP